MSTALIWLGAALLSLLSLALSVALAAVTFLNRVALQRLSADSPRLAFLARLPQPNASYRLATMLFRQASQYGATLLIVIGAERAGWSRPLALGFALGFLATVIVGQAFLARAIAIVNPRRALRSTAALVRLAHHLFFPIAAPLAWLHGMLGGGDGTEPDSVSDDEQEQEVEALIEVGERSGILEAEEGRMVRGIVDLDETMVREIMTPQNEMDVLPIDVDVDTARQTFVAACHSRLPVYRDSIDQVVGVLHARDLFRAIEEGVGESGLEPFLRPPLFVQETTSAADVLREMRVRTQMAIVVDRFGSVSGLVTLEDLLEEIVGDIRDEDEPEEELEIVPEGDGSYRIRATTHVDELEHLFALELGERAFDTVGGWIVSNLGRVPAVGEQIELDGLAVAVLEADRRRIHSVSVRRRDPSLASEG